MYLLSYMIKFVNNKIQPWWQPAIQLFAQISAWIVFPILVALFLGRWLDDRFGKEPMFLLVCVGAAFLITNVGLISQTIKAARKMEAEVQEKNKSKIQK